MKLTCRCKQSIRFIGWRTVGLHVCGNISGDVIIFRHLSIQYIQRTKIFVRYVKIYKFTGRGGVYCCPLNAGRNPTSRHTNTHCSEADLHSPYLSRHSRKNCHSRSLRFRWERVIAYSCVEDHHRNQTTVFRTLLFRAVGEEGRMELTVLGPQLSALQTSSTSASVYSAMVQLLYARPST